MGGCTSSSSCVSHEIQEEASTHYMIGYSRTSLASHCSEVPAKYAEEPETMTEIAAQNDGGGGGEGGGVASIDSQCGGSMALEAFVTHFPLPQRAKVTAGFWDMENDNESDREFAAEEVIHVLQVVCPFVNLTLTNPHESGIETQVSLGTRFISAKFRVVSHREFTHSFKPRVFHGVEEMISVWPHTVKALANHNPGSSVGVSGGGGGQQPAFRNGDRLRLIRIVACLREGKKVLECKVLRGNMQLLQLPLNYAGNFAEVDDPKGYTLLELVTIARVERTLTIHHASSPASASFGSNDAVAVGSSAPHSIPGIPSDYNGYIQMEKPQLFVQMKRVPRSSDDDDDPGHLGLGHLGGVYDQQQQQQQQLHRPFLVPIDCPIDLSPRDDTYESPDCCQMQSLKELIAKYDDAASSTPFLARIMRWDEETTVLQQNIVRPGHQLLFLKHETTAKILARDKVRDRYYMVPVDHTGSFIRCTTHTMHYSVRDDCNATTTTTSLNLRALEKSSFPFDVRFTNDGNPYSNVFDCVLPTETTLTFEAYIGDDKAAIVAKFCDSVICNRFHLPIRTKLVFQFERRWTEALPTDDSLRWSDSDVLAEEITGKTYNKLMEKYGDYEWLPAKENLPQAVTKSPKSVRQIPVSQRNGSRLLQSLHEDSSSSSDDGGGYLKPSLTPPPLQPRRKSSPPCSRPPPPPQTHASTQQQQQQQQQSSPSTGRRGVPPPPTVPREPPPPLPCRIPTSSSSTATTAAAAAAGTRCHPVPPTDRSPCGKRRQDDVKHRGLPPLPPPPPPPPPPPLPLHVSHPATYVTNHDNDKDETTSNDSSDGGQSYSYIDVETLQDSITYRQNPFPGNVATDGVSIPSDGNVSHFSSDQMQLFLREIHAPVGTINAWRQLRIDGKDFAKMSNDRLQEYRIDSTVVQFFRDRSKMRILLQL